MLLNNKKFRYYYWIVLEFTKKNAKLILLSFLLSIVTIISTITLSPYLVSFVTAQKDVVGIVGSYTYNNLPEEVLSKISNGLVFVDDKGDIIPVLAEHWELKNSGKEYTFTLKKNIFWNDGRPLLAKDIKYNFKDVEITTTGDRQIHFKLQKRLPVFATYLTTPIIRSPLIGIAGLYKVDRTKTQYGQIKELYLTPNKQNVKFLVYKFYDNEAKMINAYKLGEITQMVIYKKSIADTFKGWKNTEITKSVDYSRLLTLFYNQKTNTILKEKDVRQALAMSVDRVQFEEEGQNADSPIPPISWAYNPDLKKIQYDTELSSKILRKYNEGTRSATLNLDTYYDYLDTAEDIKTSMEKTGIKIKINTLSLQQPSDYDMLLAYWKVPLDPDQYYFWHSTQVNGNITGLKNVKIDKLLEDGRDTSNITDRKRIYYNFQRIMQDEIPAYFLYYPHIYTVKRK